MFKLLFGMLAGALLTVLTIGYATGTPKLPSLESLKRFWPPALTSPTPARKTEAATHVWAIRPQAVNGHVEVTAWGAASMEESRGRAHAVALALRTARHLAYEQLAEYLRGARTAGRSHYHGDILQQAQLTSTTSAVIRGAKVVKEEVQELPDGSVRAVVTLRYPLPRKARV